MPAAVSDEIWRAILALSAAERARLAEEIRLTLPEAPDKGDLTRQEQKVLAERMAAEADDTPGVSWEEALKEARKAVARARGGAANA